MSAARRRKERPPVMFIDIEGRIWVNVTTDLRLRPVVSRTPRTFQLRRLAAKEAKLVRRLILEGATDAWARLTA